MEERSISLKNGSLFYFDTGSGRNVLFLHGGIATPGAYEGILRYLGHTMRVIAPTHPGHGRSFPISHEWKLDDFVRTYTSFLECLSVIPDIMVGHSFGGMLALLLAKTYGNAAVIAFDPVGLPLTLTAKEYISFMTEEAAALMNRAGDLSVVRRTIPAIETLVHTIVRHPEDPVWFSEHIATFDIGDTLKRLMNRVALVWGARDRIVPVSVGTSMARMIPNCSLRIIPDAGHVYPVTMEDQVVKILSDILLAWRIS
jgi:pimeloyl-ACP methyl ester carboxylesterase